MSRDGSKYRKRGAGRPPWTNLYDTKVDVRISAAEDKKLQRMADLHGVSRSTIVRKALYDYFKFNLEDGED